MFLPLFFFLSCKSFESYPLFLSSFFLEKNMFAFFLNILRQKSGRYVCVQLLQTLNILFENISHETSLCNYSAFIYQHFCVFVDLLIFIPHLMTCFCLFVFLFPADYLLSNNHVNSIIVHKFDFSDEEIMAYYISFLKTLSLKLNNHTVHFFYNEVRLWSGPGRFRRNILQLQSKLNGEEKLVIVIRILI